MNDSRRPARPTFDVEDGRTAALPRRWTLHGLNNGPIFAATYHGVRTLPRGVSYGIGHAGTWLAWRSMASSRAAVADNLSAVFPGESRVALEARALATFRSYARDTIDFLRALRCTAHQAQDLFEVRQQDRTLFDGLRGRGRGVLLLTGHYGNWEVGSIFVRRAAGLPLTIVAMSEASPQVNRIRRAIRDALGADTIEVRQSFETALQIRRRLAGGHIVAMLVDRHYGRDRVPVTLFGRRAWFLRSPFLLAQASGAPMLPCFIERAAAGRFRLRLGRAIEIDSAEACGNGVARAAQDVADELAARIRVHPEYWYQFYRYWDAQRDAYSGLD